jgi:hypothetical protein
MFSPPQEIVLGDVIAESNDTVLDAIDDDALVGHMRAVGERVAAQMPVAGLRLRFYLSDIPQANAFSIAGGRVYMMRKMVAFLKSEDELAAVLAHELGHIVTHQQAIEYTALLKQLNVTSVGNEDDIFEKFNLLRESWPKLKSNRDLPDQDQLAADKAGLEALAHAGYDPQAFFTFFDRLAETKGKTGSWFSEFIKATPPNSKRLREINKEIATLPPGCVQPRAKNEGDSFAAWRSLVLRTKGGVRRPILKNVVWKKFLDPPLIEDFRTLRFSPDGRLHSVFGSMLEVHGRRSSRRIRKVSCFTIRSCGSSAGIWLPKSGQI